VTPGWSGGPWAFPELHTPPLPATHVEVGTGTWALARATSPSSVGPPICRSCSLRAPSWRTSGWLLSQIAPARQGPPQARVRTPGGKPGAARRLGPEGLRRDVGGACCARPATPGRTGRDTKGRHPAAQVLSESSFGGLVLSVADTASHGVEIGCSPPEKITCLAWIRRRWVRRDRYPGGQSLNVLGRPPVLSVDTFDRCAAGNGMSRPWPASESPRGVPRLAHVSWTPWRGTGAPPPSG
jgi:hypothetical protein